MIKLFLECLFLVCYQWYRCSLQFRYYYMRLRPFEVSYREYIILLVWFSTKLLVNNRNCIISLVHILLLEHFHTLLAFCITSCLYKKDKQQNKYFYKDPIWPIFMYGCLFLFVYAWLYPNLPFSIFIIPIHYLKCVLY